jgi:hypothetical protein
MIHAVAHRTPLPSAQAQTSVHEASHAVASLVLGGDVLAVSILPRRHQLGVQLGGCVSRVSLRSPLQRCAAAIVALAGGQADRRVVGVYRPHRAQGDLFRVLRLVGDDPHLISRLMRASDKLVDDCWPGIVRVAEALLVFGKLDGNEVRFAIGRKVARR